MSFPVSLFRSQETDETIWIQSIDRLIFKSFQLDHHQMYLINELLIEKNK